MTDDQEKRGTDLYESLKESATKRGDKSYCSVVAIAAAANVDYNTAYKTLAKAGRKHRHGTSYDTIFAALKSLKCTTKEMVKHRCTKCKTIRTLKREIPNKGTFMVFVSRHVLVFIDGECHDWSDDTTRRIKSIHRVERRGRA